MNNNLTTLACKHKLFRGLCRSVVCLDDFVWTGQYLCRDCSETYSKLTNNPCTFCRGGMISTQYQCKNCGIEVLFPDLFVHHYLHWVRFLENTAEYFPRDPIQALLDDARSIVSTSFLQKYIPPCANEADFCSDLQLGYFVIGSITGRIIGAFEELQQAMEASHFWGEYKFEWPPIGKNGSFYSLLPKVYIEDERGKIVSY